MNVFGFKITFALVVVAALFYLIGSRGWLARLLPGD